MYVVVGANGYLGSYIVNEIIKKTNDEIIATARDLSRVFHHDRIKWIKCDIQSDSSVDKLCGQLAKLNNIKIIYLAAYHHPDEVESNRTLAWDINVTCLSKFLNKVNFADQLFYASTDSVYGESTDFYHFKETDLLNPVNFYGHCKCAAESLVVHREYCVARFPFLISPSLVYKPHFYDNIVNSLKNGIPFKMFQNSYRSSLSFENAAKLLVMLMEKGNSPSIVNICGDKDLSKYDVGLLIAERENYPKDLIVPVSFNDPMTNFLTQRASSTLMDNSLIKSLLRLRSIDIFQNPQSEGE